MREPEPSTDLPLGLRRVLAPNPSPMTLHGTNTYLLGRSSVAVIDPGPDSPAHLQAIEAALPPGARISHVLVTHAHRDHSPLARPLAARWGAPVLAFGDARAGRNPRMAGPEVARLGGGEGVDSSFRPDLALPDTAVIEGPDWRLRVLWTPGHMGNHICLGWDDVVFSGDHVMGWASTLVSPPDGDMGDYMASLDKLAAARPRLLLPGHGDPVSRPAERIATLAAHRRTREAAIRALLAAAPATVAGLTERIYTDTPKALIPAARRNVLAHLIDLQDRGLVTTQDPPDGAGTIYAPITPPE